MEILFGKYTRRCSNFTPKENEIFRQLIEENQDILFCTQTDSNTIQKKNRTWEILSKKFNTISPTQRTVKQLKHRFDNMKRNARKIITDATVMTHEDYIDNTNTPATDDDMEEKESTKDNKIVKAVDDVFVTRASSPLLRRISKPLRRIRKVISTPQELRDKKKIIDLQLKHMDERRTEERERHIRSLKHEEEIHALKKTKLVLEIQILEETIKNSNCGL